MATVQAPVITTNPTSRLLVRPVQSQFLAAHFSAAVAFRYKHALLGRCTLNSKDHKLGTVVACNFQRKSFVPLHVLSTPLPNVSGSLLSFDVPILRQRRKSTIHVQAYKDPFSPSVLAKTEKPEWWWRTLSCIPYLLALQVSDTGFFIQRFIEKFQFFENIVFYIPGAVNRLPTWFPMLYCYLAYNGIVNNKDWPLFFRFHVIMGILLEISLHLIWQFSNFMPFVHYNGTLGMYYWAGVAIAYILIISECIRCALSGRYVKIPFLGRRAMLHAVLGLGAYQLPF